jgi:hypothetical protein
MAIDGFVLDVADTPANRQEFGSSGGEKNPAPFPQIHLAGLGDCDVANQRERRNERTTDADLAG